MTNIFKTIESKESSRIRHLKINKYYKNNHCWQVHQERNQYDYHLGYSKYDGLNKRVMSSNKIENPHFDP